MGEVGEVEVGVGPESAFDAVGLPGRQRIGERLEDLLRGIRGWKGFVYSWQNERCGQGSCPRSTGCN